MSGVETVLLTGATAQVGVFALPGLLSAGYPVLALSRQAPEEPVRLRESRAGESGASHLVWLHPDAVLNDGSGTAGEAQYRHLRDVGVLLSCGPVELAAQLVPFCSNLRRVVCISTSSVYTKPASPDAAERLLIAEIIAAEISLSHACRERGITLAVLRPTLIYGCGLDQNVSRIARMIRRLHFFPLAGRAAGRRQPVHAADLATLALRLIQAEGLQSLESPVGGGSVLTYRRMVEQVFAAHGLAPRIVSLAPSMLEGLCKVIAWLPGAWLPGMQGVNAGFVLRQNQDQVFDDGGLREQFEFKPRPFAPTMADFCVPDYARTLQPW